MAWLGGWLREIILVVLMAAFVEMLLPSKSMERYARLVLSLLVLLTMLGPIISLLKGDAVNELSLAMDQQNAQSGMFTGSGQGGNTLEKILADGQKLAQGRQEQSLKLAAGEIAEQMKEQIMTEAGQKGAEVTVALAMMQPDALGGEAVPAISSVIVTLPPVMTPQSGGSVETGGDGTRPASSPIYIPPVDNVEVSLKDGEQGNQEATGTAAAAATAASAPSGPGAAEEGSTAREKAAVIEGLLTQKWGLEPGVIKVQGGGEAGADRL